MNISKWSILKSQYPVKDRWISLRADTCQLPDSKVIEPFYVLEYPDWVNVVAITKRKEVVLVRQYRHGYGQVLLELPSGTMEAEDTSAEVTVRRELLEETGYAGREFICTGVISPNPSNQSNLTHCFLALDVEWVRDPQLDETEQIEVVLKPLDQVIESFRKQEFLQAQHISSLFQALTYLGLVHF